MRTQEGRPLINLVGDRFGKLTVIELKGAHPVSKGRFLWDCVCDCGEKVVRPGYVLRQGKTHKSKSCDSCIPIRPPKEDLSGERFGKLTVKSYKGVEKAEKGRNAHAWNCECDCGKKFVEQGTRLTFSRMESCGCDRLGPKKDLTGVRVGAWTVVSYKGRDPIAKSKFLWNCICDCGKKKEVRGHAIRDEAVEPCRCLKRKDKAPRTSQRKERKRGKGTTKQHYQPTGGKRGAPKGVPHINLLDNRYGKLTVTGLNGPHPVIKSHFLWDCVCDCGKEVVRHGRVLREGRIPKSKSCGCDRPIPLPKVDLVGERFGKLTVKSYKSFEKKGKGKGKVKVHRWNCVCDCGETYVAEGPSLKSGHLQSCGCSRTGPRQDLTGERFGKLTVKSYKGPHPKTKSEFLWNCICDCGKKREVRGGGLRSGNTKSCGCGRIGRTGTGPTGPRIDLTGKRVGKLTVKSLKGRHPTTKHEFLWNCICDCGNKKEVCGHVIRHATKQSCGCDRPGTGPRKDLTGARFGKLTVKNLKGRHPKARGVFLWNCICDCGEKKAVSGSSLRAGRSKSCGCGRGRKKLRRNET